MVMKGMESRNVKRRTMGERTSKCGWLSRILDTRERILDVDLISLRRDPVSRRREESIVRVRGIRENRRRLSNQNQ